MNYRCLNCGKDISRGTKFCSEKCKEDYHRETEEMFE
ncbi:MAG: DUF2116 family Zn-ribbon domain-containing protein [Nanoarchaeota archaeon]